MISSLNQPDQVPERAVKDQGRKSSLPVEVASSAGRRRSQPENKAVRSDVQSSKSRGAGLVSKDSGAVGTAHFNPDGWASQRSQHSNQDNLDGVLEMSNEVIELDKEDAEDRGYDNTQGGHETTRGLSMSFSPPGQSTLGQVQAADNLHQSDIGNARRSTMQRNLAMPLHQIVDANSNLRSEHYLVAQRAKAILREPHNRETYRQKFR